jgi:hypothetical protein
MHIEQPASRHSAPASRKIWSRPFGLRLRLHLLRSGNHHNADAGMYFPAFQNSSGVAQIGDARIRAASDEHHVERVAEQRFARRQIHVAKRFRQRIALQRIGDVARIGYRAVIGIPMPGLVPKVIMGSSAAASMVMLLSYVAPSSVGSWRQRATRPVPGSAFGRIGRPHILIGGVVGRDQPAARAGFDRHIAHRHALFHGQRADGRSAIFENELPVPPPMPMRAISARIMSLAVTPGFWRTPSTRTW